MDERTVRCAERIVRRAGLTAGYQVSEIVHVWAIYLGIAVLVTTVLSAAVPSLREQARQIHEALVIALRPDGLEQDMLASFGADDSPATVEGDTGTADAALARPSFSKALRASIAGQHEIGRASGRERVCQ